MTPSRIRFAFSTIAVVAVAMLAGGAGSAAGQTSYQEPFRPQFHYTPAKNWMNDPNGLVYYKGEYHLFYQYNPFGSQWGHMSWGHAVSRDLVHWRELPVAIPEQGDELVFSGSAVIDRHNTSGLGTRANPPMVAIYTAAKPGSQAQALAYSTDRGRTFKRYSGNPVLDIGSAEFPDPKVFRYAPAARNPPTAVTLVVDGQGVRSSTGQENEALNWTNWNVAELQGKTAHIDIVDENTGGWGHINADQFTFSDEP